MTFQDLGLSDPLLAAIENSGYTIPTPIQEKAIPLVLMGRDILGCAQTGTGKTAGFVLPMIDILAEGKPKARMPRSLILEPTRELAAQVAEKFDDYGQNHKLTKALLIGGSSFVDQKKILDRGVDVLIATPGRLLDLFERGNILMSDVKILVIDEADRMLDMGFIPDVEEICSKIPAIRQTLFFSATMPPEIKRLSEKFLTNPKEVTVARPATTASTIEDFITNTHPRDKRKVLRGLIEEQKVHSALVFCNRKRDVDVVARSLKNRDFNAAALHGDMTQDKRTETLDRFRAGEIRILVASDVAARGLDINDVSHVFNFDVPIHPDDYVHRIGRTGRAGKSGRAYTLATREDEKFVAAIERVIGRKITVLDGSATSPAPAPAPAEVKADDVAAAPVEEPAASAEKPAEKAAATEEEAKPARTRRSRARKDTPRDDKPEARESRDENKTREGRGDGRGDRQSHGSRNEPRNHKHPDERPEAKPLPDTEKEFGKTDQVPAFLLQEVTLSDEEKAAA